MDSTTMDGATILPGEWTCEGDRLIKNYLFKYSSGRIREQIVQLIISISRNTVLGGFNRHVAVMMKPSFVKQGEGYVSVQLAPLDALAESPICNAWVGNANDGSWILQPESSEAINSFVKAIAECREMRLRILTQNGIALDMPLPNDDQYKKIADPFFALARARFPQGKGLLFEYLNEDEKGETTDNFFARFARSFRRA